MEPTSLSELRSARSARDPWLLDLVRPEVGGGHTYADQLPVIAEHPDVTALRVSGLDQRTFERLVTDHGAQFSALALWKCPRLTDLTPLEDLPNLRMVSVFWNQRTTRLWDLTRTPRLTGLHFDDFTRLHDLRDVAVGDSLRELSFGDAVWDAAVFETLEPVSELTGLRSLTFTAKRIEDGRIQPLAALQSLETLRFPVKMFTTQQVAWLRARLPDSLDSVSLQPLFPLARGYTVNGVLKDVRLVGRRKPTLSSVADADRIARHVEEFERMVDEFGRDPALAPD